MKIVTAYSTKNIVIEAVEDIKLQMKELNPKAILFFASSNYEPSALCYEMKEAFQGIPVFGCSTAGEITSGAMLKGSLVAMGFNDEVIKDIKISIVENISNNPDVKHSIGVFEEFYGESMSTMDHTKYLGLILIDGLSAAEEKVIDRIGDLTNVPFIGGSAGDDLKFTKTYIYENGKVYTDAALLALIKTECNFDIIKTQSFNITDKILVANKVDEKTRTVHEFNHEPAAIAYANALGVPVSEAAKSFMHNPVGLIVQGEPYVRSPQQIIGTDMVFYCSILEGMELSILESKNIVLDTKAAIEVKEKEIGKIEGIINFNCILRTLELEQKEQVKDYADIFAEVPTIGFSTYGEQYIGHINQTSTMVVFNLTK